MDALALLCNLHADGPATARLLRRAGLRSPADIESCTTDRLAEVLGVSPAFARRFTREAHLLGVRMGSSSPLEIEEQADVDVREAGARTESAASPFAPIGESTPRSRTNEPRPSERAFPFANPPRGSATSATRFPAARTPPFASTPTPDVSTVPTPARVVPVAGTPLRPHIIEGLDSTWCDRLIAQGVLTLETLADSAGLKLAKRLELPYTRLLDLQCLAKRALSGERSEREVTVSNPEVAQAAERIVPTQSAREPIFILQPTRRAPSYGTPATRNVLGDCDPEREPAPLHTFGPRIDSEVAGPFA